jgi:hypothetical protein
MRRKVNIRTFDQLDWGKAMPPSQPTRPQARVQLRTNPITHEDNLTIEPSNSESENKFDSGENNALEINKATFEEAITVAGSSCDESPNC